MKSFIVILILIISVQASSQDVRLLKLDQLFQRVNAGRDTTYVINFWATWCAPCLKELPYFEKLSVQFKNEKLKVLLISLDFKSKIQTTVVPYARKKSLKNEVFLLNESDQQEYINRIDQEWSGALPATLIIQGNRRKFFEQEFNYAQLLKEYKNYSKQ